MINTLFQNLNGLFYSFSYTFFFKIRDRVGKFEKFIQENEAKKGRAIQKYQSELKLKEFKIAEARVVADELDSLKSK